MPIFCWKKTKNKEKDVVFKKVKKTENSTRSETCDEQDAYFLFIYKKEKQIKDVILKKCKIEKEKKKKY
jgi:hypothetical protein